MAVQREHEQCNQCDNESKFKNILHMTKILTITVPWRRSVCGMWYSSKKICMQRKREACIYFIYLKPCYYFIIHKSEKKSLEKSRGG